MQSNALFVLTAASKESLKLCQVNRSPAKLGKFNFGKRLMVSLPGGRGGVGRSLILGKNSVAEKYSEDG